MTLQFAEQDPAGVHEVVVARVSLQAPGGHRLALGEAAGVVQLDDQDSVDLRVARGILVHGGDEVVYRLVPAPCLEGRLRRRQPVAHAETF